jgi:hypothetical protein
MCGPIFWLLCYWLIVSSLDPTIMAAQYISACKAIVVKFTGVSFVDDTGLGVTSDFEVDPSCTVKENDKAELNHVIQKLRTLAQHWERLLFTTGGAINLQKSFWYLVAWHWKNGQPKLSTINDTPMEISLTSGNNMNPEILPRIEATQAFRTLGVYISASGCQKEQIKVLRTSAQRYYESINTSVLTPSEAYISYSSYMRPRLTYSLPCTSSTQLQCRQVQAPALSPRAIIFSGPQYGGLSIPYLYNDQGIGQLQLLVGHIKLGDDTGNLILFLLSHLQSAVGSDTSLFSLSYSTYERIIECNWLTSVWSYVNTANITIDIENQWLPQLARERDTMILDHALTLQFTTQQLRQINASRIYLQVLTISDITTADGTHIITGQRARDRVSNLHWPNIRRPTSWAAWKVFLASISTNGKLRNSLGSWTGTPHKTWTWYYNPGKEVIYQNLSENNWLRYDKVCPIRFTRHQNNLYDNPTPTPTPDLDNCYPTMVSNLRTGILSNPSTSKFCLNQTQEEPQMWEAYTPAPFHNTPFFFQCLLGDRPPTLEQCNKIREAIQNQNLLTCSDGAYCPHANAGSHSWVFSNATRNYTVSGAGTDDGYPTSMSAYRSELGGILAALYIIHRICDYYNITTGKATLFCDNKGALTKTFHPIHQGISPFLSSDYDLLQVASKSSQSHLLQS